MGRRNYRRTRSDTYEVISGTVAISNRLPWWGVVVFTLILYLVLDHLAPSWIQAKIDAAQGRPSHIALEAIFSRRLHWLSYMANAVLMVGAFFTLKNYLTERRFGTYDERNVGWLARLLARWID